MGELVREILDANQGFVARFGDRGKLDARPTRKVAILTCMDARIDTFAITGLDIGDMNVIRNAGGRASADAIRSLLISTKFLGSVVWFIIQHTDCGMQSVSGDEIVSSFKSKQDHAGSIDWLAIENQPDTLLQDARKIQSHPLVPEEISLYAMMYDVKTGRLIDYTGEI